MSGLPSRDLSIAERVVWFFQGRVSEAHRSSIEVMTGITDPEQFDQSIARARDLGAENHHHLRLTPIYEREGWWTADPTRRLAGMALYESVKRNYGEAQRNARVYAEFDPAGTAALAHASVLNGSIHMLEKELPEMLVAASSDYVLDRVDRAIARNQGFVLRTPAV